MIRTAADVLEAAADYIEQNGWCRGTFRRSDGHVCALGAITRVSGANYMAEQEAIDALGLYVGTRKSTNWQRTVYRFNDRQKRREPVLRALRECAADLRARAVR